MIFAFCILLLPSRFYCLMTIIMSKRSNCGQNTLSTSKLVFRLWSKFEANQPITDMTDNSSWQFISLFVTHSRQNRKKCLSLCYAILIYISTQSTSSELAKVGGLCKTSTSPCSFSHFKQRISYYWSLNLEKINEVCQKDVYRLQIMLWNWPIYNNDMQGVPIKKQSLRKNSLSELL